MFKANHGLVFRRYVASYLTVVLTVCIVLGLALTLLASDQLKQSELELYEGRLAMAASHVERQFSALEDIRLDIKTSRTFQPFYVQGNVIRELELLDAFSGYTSYSSWVKEYYLWYRSSGRVYGYSGAYDADVFLRHVMGGMPQAELDSAMESNDEISLVVSGARPDSALICLPFRFGASKATDGESVLLFLVRLNQIRQDVWNIAGAERGASLSLEYKGQKLFGDVTGDSLSATGSGGKVALSMRAPEFASFERLTSFETLTLVIMLAVCLAGVGMALYAAWRSYQPLRKLYSKYIGAAQSPSNEWQTIEELLNNTLTMNTLSQKQMETQVAQLGRQRAWLKQQLVMMLISGNDSPVVQKQIQEMGYDMAHELYAVLFLHTQGSNTEGLLKDIEDFTDEECALYAAELQAKREYAVLINFDEEERCQELLELLHDMLNARNLTARMQLSRSCDTMSELAAASIEALNAHAVLPKDVHENQTNDDLRQLVALIKAGDAAAAQALLNGMIEQTENSCPSYLMRIYQMNRLAQRIIAFAIQNGLSPATEMEAEPSQKPEQICQRMRRIVAGMCASAPAAESADESDSAAVAYIRENCLNADLSLSSTAQALGISTKQVSRLLRASINMTFKEYLLQLRMEAAKQLLRDNLTISATAERVGYFNISHFIKCFKSCVGVTPGEWKKNV